MPQRLIISDNPEDPGNPPVLEGEAIDAAARDPVAIGKVMVDQVWAEGTDPTGGALYYERRTNRHRRLGQFETGHEDFMTGGWVRVLVSAEQRQRDRFGMERAAADGLVRLHGTHRGVLLVEFLNPCHAAALVPGLPSRSLMSMQIIPTDQPWRSPSFESWHCLPAPALTLRIEQLIEQPTQRLGAGVFTGIGNPLPAWPSPLHSGNLSPALCP
jgi:hypothetical protein